MLKKRTVENKEKVFDKKNCQKNKNKLLKTRKEAFKSLVCIIYPKVQPLKFHSAFFKKIIPSSPIAKIQFQLFSFLKMYFRWHYERKLYQAPMVPDKFQR